MWLSYLYSLGCDDTIAHDIVQEMYIKVDAYIKRKNADIMFNENEVNYYFFWITLKNLYFDYRRKKSKDPLVYYSNVSDVNDAPLPDEYEDKDDYDMHRAVIEWYDSKDYIEITEADDLIYYDKEQLNNYYLRKVFEECFLEKKKVSELSRDTKITYWSLRNTIKIIKNQIQELYEARNSTREDI